ncbi:glycoside hydrolase family 9 protein [Glycomyces xiaoerkulensis]|uniref:glycoside hydrolase family 9 protein n=1 Tax=Glycomyces xiaoerkulensis TaxID=2038139 RepID=UPI0012FFDFF7|nr:glycoside hydrolase family 9 protein [Glycomyces xiaoerkulensis]
MRNAATLRRRRTRGALVALGAAAAVAAGAVALVPAHADHNNPGPEIRVNQYAYTADGAKGATYVSDDSSGRSWELLDASGNAVASGTTSVHGLDQASGDSVHNIDFSDYDIPGADYRIQIDGRQSHPFEITGDPWGDLRDDALAFFYHQRSGIEIEEQYVGAEYARPAGHVNVAPNQGDDGVGCLDDGCDYTLDVAGGWYDAGDHGKYVVNGGISTWQLQNAYERTLHTPDADPDVFADGTLAVPESSNGVPDLLDEARWHLEFMMSMQVPEGEQLAGMAHHKVHDMAWTGHPMPPHEDPEVRRLSPPSVTATLNLAAAAAQASRLWEDHDPAFAAETLEVARTAYDAAQANPDRYPDPNDGTGGGAYSDDDASDEFYWAAAELFTTTGESRYRSDLTASEWWFGEGFTDHGFAWPSTSPLADLTLALAPSGLSESERQAVQDSVVDGADGYVAAAGGQGYPVPYAPEDWDYAWGSNSQVLNNATVIAYAHDLTGDPAYLDAVAEAMDYLLGRNALGQSYVTGYGEKDAHNQHHRFWANQADSSFPNPPPGTLAGGPNSSLQDETAQEHLSGCAGPKCYIDDIDSWSTNEVTINWNAPLAWIAAFLSDRAGDDGTEPTPSPTPTEPTPTEPTPTDTEPVGDLAPVDDLSAEVGFDWVELTWDTPPWDRQIEISRDGTAIDVLPSGSTSFSETGLDFDTEYTYSVSAVPEENEHAFSSTVTVTTTFPPDEGPCSGDLEIVNDWGSGFQANVTVSNVGDRTIDQWSLRWDWSGDTEVTYLWNAEWSQSGTTVTASNLSWNGRLEPGQTAEFGFVGSGTAEVPGLVGLGCSITR